MVADAMDRAPYESRWGKLPALDSRAERRLPAGPGAPLHDDRRPALSRLGAPHRRCVHGGGAARQLRRAVDEVGLRRPHRRSAAAPARPRQRAGRRADAALRARIRPAVDRARDDTRRPSRRMLDRILASANPDGMLFNQVDAKTLAPINRGLSDNWGYVYGAVYTFYQVTGEVKYRDAVRKVLRQPAEVPGLRVGAASERRAPAARVVRRLRRHHRERAVSRESRARARRRSRGSRPRRRACSRMLRPDGHLEDWYGEGNFNRTLLLYALMKSQGVMPAERAPGMQLGAVRDGDGLQLHVGGVPAVAAAVRLRAPPARHQPGPELRPAERVPRVVRRRAELAVPHQRRHGSGPPPARLGADAGRTLRRRRLADRAGRPAAVRHPDNRSVADRERLTDWRRGATRPPRSGPQAFARRGTSPRVRRGAWVRPTKSRRTTPCRASGQGPASSPG